ncbi:porin family protein [Candidatus Marifrigoribacter sp. Uisw_064]|uniref:porin family protein n=1 Tax=Candidatus Marifrigoribacter sp. Uisw_064 TaxID=3230970 RepID=UPI003D5A5AC0
MFFNNQYILTYILTFLSYLMMAQDSIPPIESDDHYREDQFYMGVTYNLISSAPSGVKLNGVSGGIQLGFLRDMPINEKRNIAVALGVGLTLDQFGHNLFINENVDGQTTFSVLDSDVDYDRNRFSFATVEVPFEFRWRSSTRSTFKFWRVYTGIRIGYSFWNNANFKQSELKISKSSINEFESLRLGATLSFGYSTFNFFAYYSLNPFFNNDAITTGGQKIEMKALKIGIIFYIL